MALASASPRAASFIRARGGRLYIWGQPMRDESTAFLRWDTMPPVRDVDFRLYHARTFEFYLEPGLWFGEWLEVKLRFPPRRLTLDWEGRAPSAASG